MPALYIADGHHRSAAASRVAAARHQQGREQSADAFLSVIFPHHQMKILDYNRVVRDLHGLEKSALLARLGHRVRGRRQPRPSASGAAPANSACIWRAAGTGWASSPN
jgi:hypothetical protein